MTVKPPNGVRSWENLAGCVGRSRLRNGPGHESFRFVRNGLESFLFRLQANIRGRHGAQHAKEVKGREGGAPVKVLCRGERTLEVESSCDPLVPTGSRSSKNRVGQGWAEPETRLTATVPEHCVTRLGRIYPHQEKGAQC